MSDVSMGYTKMRGMVVLEVGVMEFLEENI